MRGVVHDQRPLQVAPQNVQIFHKVAIHDRTVAAEKAEAGGGVDTVSEIRRHRARQSITMDLKQYALDKLLLGIKRVQKGVRIQLVGGRE